MSYRALVVEDDAALASVLSDSLVAEGIEVAKAADGIEAIAKGSTEGFDLILLDLLLPHCNGFEVCRELRGRGIQAPILMLTARDDVRDKVVGLDLGADDYLTK